MSKLKIIVGSTRPNRNADRVLPWVVARATAHDAFEVEVLDLRDHPLPIFQETFETIGDRAHPTFSDPSVRAWNDRILDGDAFLVLTTEYNHSVPAVLKNALDSVFVTYGFRNKPVGYVGYSGSAIGAARAVEHLAHIAIEAEAVPLRNTTLVGRVTEAFDADGIPHDPMTEAALRITLDDLAWWADVLAPARAHQLPPGNARLHRLAAAITEERLAAADT